MAAPNYSKNKEVEDISTFLILTLKTVGRDEPIGKLLFRRDNHRAITWDKKTVRGWGGGVVVWWVAKAEVTLRLSQRISPITGLASFVWLSFPELT